MCNTIFICVQCTSFSSIEKKLNKDTLSSSVISVVTNAWLKIEFQYLYTVLMNVYLEQRKLSKIRTLHLELWNYVMGKGSR